MKKLFINFLLSSLTLCPMLVSASNYWQQVDATGAPKELQRMHPTKFMVYTLNESTLKLLMWNLSEDPNEGMIVALPLPDGTTRDFKVWQTPMMPAQLAQKYPDIKTFTAYAIDDPMVTAKLDFTVYGFSAMIFDGENTSFVDPYDNFHDGFYMVHYKRDETRDADKRMRCEFRSEADEHPGGEQFMTVNGGLPKLGQKTFNGHQKRTYRLALSCSNQYAQAATGLPTPTITQVFSKMTTSMNRVNGVYNREFSVQMNFCANEDTLIWPTATGSINGNDPFNTINSNGTACLSTNQTTCTNRIGSANYDCGHVFTTGGGGVSGLGIVCSNSQKARSVTGLPSPVGDGFDIDYVAHEMGHEFGSEHTFNNNSDGSCGGNASTNYAYEPGSGSSILAYAGICPPDNLQPHSDAYFHASSLVQITNKLNGSEDVCAAKVATANKLVYLPAFSASYKIPYKTPFELIAPTAQDSVADTLISYCWEQWNRGDFGARLQNTYFRGPIFRSFSPKSYDTVRTFPKMSLILAGTLKQVTVNNNMGEKAPDTTRYLTFKLTVRNIINGLGCFLFPDDTVHIDAITTGAANNYEGFKVTSQGTTGITFDAGSTQTITWNKVGTDGAPYNVSNVIIYMSKDGGYTWPYVVGTFPNTGTASITVPDPGATTATVRFKVKAVGNVFFNVNLKNVKVNGSGVSVANVRGPLSNTVKVFPVPAHDMLHMTSEGSNNIQVSVYNTLGQEVWGGNFTGSVQVPVGDWARGTYFVRFADINAKEQATKTIVIN
ncbi:hypothetical protein GCM10023093_20360 [Nemorincola caseinilytica]|uniref:Secretion system C-terminal sorting domain-containing protein n=1 Tax=Nemorincola caseinilytica TaxID=2054315 RepID=A0ABP8NH93_9BACT